MTLFDVALWMLAVWAIGGLLLGLALMIVQDKSDE